MLRRLQRASQARKVQVVNRRQLLAPMENFPRRLSLSFRRKRPRRLKSQEEQPPLMMARKRKAKLRMKVIRNLKQPSRLAKPHPAMYSVVQQQICGKVCWLLISGLEDLSPPKLMLKRLS